MTNSNSIEQGREDIVCPDCGLMSCVCFDDSDAIWCERCHGTGSIDCYCGGDFCVCDLQGERDCPRCDGQGEFIPKPGQLEREAEQRCQISEILKRAMDGDHHAE